MLFYRAHFFKRASGFCSQYVKGDEYMKGDETRDIASDMERYQYMKGDETRDTAMV